MIRLSGLKPDRRFKSRNSNYQEFAGTGQEYGSRESRRSPATTETFEAVRTSILRFADVGDFLQSNAAGPQLCSIRELEAEKFFLRRPTEGQIASAGGKRLGRNLG